jgi:hypothetical protein
MPRLCLLATVSIALAPAALCQRPYDLVIRGGRVLHGS